MLNYFFRLVFVWTCFATVAFGADQPKVVEAVTVKPTTIAKSVKLIGQIKAKREAYIKATSPGVVQGIVAEEGSKVRKGALLAYLRNDALKRGSGAADSNTSVLKEQYERDKKLFDDGVISKDALQKSANALSNARMGAASSKVLLEESEFRAPFDGVCGIFRVTEGAYVNAGDDIVSFVNPDELMLELSVPEKLVSKVKVGSDVNVLKQTSQILSSQRSIDPVTHMGLARATITKCDECLIGSYVDVGVVVDKREKALGVPQEALFLKDGKPQVFVIREGKAAQVAVETGLIGDSLVEITKGLTANDIVVTRGRMKLREGVDVKVAS